MRRKLPRRRDSISQNGLRVLGFPEISRAWRAINREEGMMSGAVSKDRRPSRLRAYTGTVGAHYCPALDGALEERQWRLFDKNFIKKSGNL
jgi:hypothetical protein